MMRASVLILVATVTTAACRDNPGFSLSGGADGDASETAATGEATTTGGSTAGETGPAVCTPTAATPVDDACTQFPQPAIPPNLAKSELFNEEDCGVAKQLHVKRTGDILHACNDEVCGDCPMDRSVPIGKASDYSQYDDLLPRDGQCARIWHTSGNIQGTGEACNSTAYAVFDIEDGNRLRFAVAYGVADPFAGVAGFDFEAGTAQPAPCTPSSTLQDECDLDQDALYFDFNFRFGTCEIPHALQRSIWTDIVVDDIDYTLELLSAYQCYPGDLFFTWFLHR
jgi:hypothetical protein